LVNVLGILMLQLVAAANEKTCTSGIEMSIESAHTSAMLQVRTRSDQDCQEVGGKNPKMRLLVCLS